MELFSLASKFPFCKHENAYTYIVFYTFFKAVPASLCSRRNQLQVQANPRRFPTSSGHSTSPLFKGYAKATHLGNPPSSTETPLWPKAWGKNDNIVDDL